MKTGNTKKIHSLLIVFLIAGLQFSSAQNKLLTENKLVVPGKRWVFQITSGEPPWEVKRDMCYEIGNDTIITDDNYKKLVLKNCTQPQEIRGYLRETDNGKVYFLNNDIHPEEEFLLYDFGMQVGDTTFYEYEQTTYYYALDSSGTNDDGRKLFYISESFGRSEIWIEGVGAKIGLLKEVMTGESQIFTCCVLNDELLYQNPDFGSCYFEENDILTVNAGNDIIVCPLAEEEIVLGGNPSASGGVKPYTYTWSGKHFDLKYPTGIPSWIYASDILDDTTKSNPVITERRNIPGSWTTYYLEVEDASGNVQVDSIKIIQSYFILKSIYRIPATIYKGDSIRFFGDPYLHGNYPIKKYILSPSHGLSDTTDIYGWAKPDSSITYYMEAINSAGCISGKVEYWQIEVIDTMLVSVETPEISFNISIYPIPAKDRIIINAHQGHKINKIELYNLTGICFYRNTIIEANLYELQATRFPEGTYILKVSNGKEVVTQKIVIY